MIYIKPENAKVSFKNLSTKTFFKITWSPYQFGGKRHQGRSTLVKLI